MFKVGDVVKHKQGSRFYLARVLKVGKDGRYMIADLDDGMVWVMSGSDIERC